jgi:hypothetical protein
MPELLRPWIASPELASSGSALSLGVLFVILVTEVDVCSPPTSTASPSAARAGSGRPIALATKARTPPAAIASRSRRERAGTGAEAMA